MTREGSGGRSELLEAASRAEAARRASAPGLVGRPRSHVLFALHRHLCDVGAAALHDDHGLTVDDVGFLLVWLTEEGDRAHERELQRAARAEQKARRRCQHPRAVPASFPGAVCPDCGAVLTELP